MNKSLDQDGFKWTDALIKTLIQLRYERREDFRTAHRPKDVWLRIVLDLKLGNQVTADECSGKWSSLLAKFKEMECKISDGSSSEELGWPHYNQMQSVLKNLEAYEDSIKSTRKIYEFPKLNLDGLKEYESSLRNRENKISERFVSAAEEQNRLLKVMNKYFEEQGNKFIRVMQRFYTVFDLTEDQSMFAITEDGYDLTVPQESKNQNNVSQELEKEKDMPQQPEKRDGMPQGSKDEDEMPEGSRDEEEMPEGSRAEDEMPEGSRDSDKMSEESCDEWRSEVSGDSFSQESADFDGMSHSDYEDGDEDDMQESEDGDIVPQESENQEA